VHVVCLSGRESLARGRMSDARHVQPQRGLAQTPVAAQKVEGRTGVVHELVMVVVDLFKQRTSQQARAPFNIRRGQGKCAGAEQGREQGAHPCQVGPPEGAEQSMEIPGQLLGVA